MSGYVYKNRSTGQVVDLPARSARFDALTDNWELLDGPKNAEPAGEQPPATEAAEPAEKPATKPPAKRTRARRPSKEA